MQGSTGLAACVVLVLVQALVGNACCVGGGRRTMVRAGHHYGRRVDGAALCRTVNVIQYCALHLAVGSITTRVRQRGG